MYRIAAFTLLLFAVSSAVFAQTPGMDGPRSHREVLAMGLYPPDIIMRHQQRLGISSAQRKNMLGLVRAFQNEVAEVQWNMQNEQQLMRQALAEKPIDNKVALSRVEKVLEMESQFKMAHFKLLIAIKNELTEEQIAMIEERVKERRK